MALTPSADKNAIKAILESDPFIIDELGYKAKDILTYGKSDDEITSDTKNIFIVSYTAPKSQNGKHIRVVYGIETLSTASNSGDALRAAERIKTLFDYCDIGNNHITEIYDGIIELSSPRDTVKYGLSVTFETSI